jgi:hypothetical protein
VKRWSIRSPSYPPPGRETASRARCVRISTRQFQLPVSGGFCQLRLAELADASGDPVRAKVLLDKALPRLEAVRSAAQMDQWDEGAVAAGHALRDRLAN